MKTIERFIEAQANTYQQALAELQSGQKRTHWMWFVFPQIDGLGHTDIACFYAIKNILEAKAYLQHPLLGARLIECTQAVLAIKDKTLLEIFGKPDNRKFCSCMTLFAEVADNRTLFENAIDQFCNGQRDIRTLDILALPKVSQ
jgi:uncharacterized protein (DUF1810 family)